MLCGNVPWLESVDQVKHPWPVELDVVLPVVSVVVRTRFDQFSLSLHEFSGHWQVAD